MLIFKTFLCKEVAQNCEKKLSENVKKVEISQFLQFLGHSEETFFHKNCKFLFPRAVDLVPSGSFEAFILPKFSNLK